jgi:RNA polymerase sigma-70 factor (ECF subfamily)
MSWRPFAIPAETAVAMTVQPEVRPPSTSDAAHPDELLLRAFLDGDATACRTIRGWLEQLLRRNPYGLPRDDAEDVVQHSLVCLWRACSREGFRLRTSLHGLARTIVLGRCIDRHRRRRAMVELDDTLPDQDPGPAELAAHADQWAQVKAALARLGDSCQELVRLHFLEELSYAEIARRSGGVEATLRFRMFQCMKRLRSMLAGAGAPG